MNDSANADTHPVEASPTGRRELGTERACPGGFGIAEIEDALRLSIEHETLSIPVYPAAASEVQRVLSNENFTLTELTGVVSEDPGLSAAVLDYANSAGIRRGRSVVTVKEALSRTGTRRLLGLVVSAELSRVFLSSGLFMPLKCGLWRQCLATAHLARELGFLRGISDEICFLAGLLQDVGSLVVVGQLEQQLEKRGDGTRLSRDSILSLAFRHHLVAGKIVASRWNLPAPYGDVIDFHHGGTSYAGVYGELVEICRIADIIVSLAESKPHIDDRDLAAISGLTARESEALAVFLPTLPRLLAALTLGRDEGGERDGLVPRPMARAPQPLVGRHLNIKLGQKHAETPFEVHALGVERLWAVGDGKLQDGALVRLTFEHDDIERPQYGIVETSYPHDGKTLADIRIWMADTQAAGAISRLSMADLP